MAYKIVNDDSLTSVANAIRVKGSISGTLEFPDGFVSAIQNLSPSPTIESLSVTSNGTYTAPSGVDGYSPISVNVSNNEFVVTLSWDDDYYSQGNGAWIPDCTINELQNAYTSDKEIVFVCEPNHNPTFWVWDDDYVFVYGIFTAGGNNETIIREYVFTTQGIEFAGDTRYIYPNFESPSRTYTPTTSTQTETITYDASDDFNGIDHVDITVNAIPSQYKDTTDATATADKILSGYTAYANGQKLTGTASGGITPSGTISITQNGTVDVTQYASADVNVSGGGGGVSVPPKEVNFYDYDGTVVDAYTASDFAALSAMPANPSHDGLTAQGWNWSLADAKAYVAKYGRLNIGQMYVTTSGDTEIDIQLSIGRNKPYLGCCPKGTVDIDWGDGSAHDTLTGTSTSTLKSIQHTYPDTGEMFTIKLHMESGSIGFIGNSSGKSSVLYNGNPSTADGQRAYQNAVKEIRCGSHLTSIGSYAFQNCSSLVSITIPESVTSISTNAFYNCSSLVSITIPESVTSISTSAIQNCFSLASVTIPESVTSISSSVFYNCSSLASVTIPESVTSISGSVFYNCYLLASVTIPESVTSISSSAIQNCFSLASVTIPKSVTSIGGLALRYCTSLSYLTFKPTTPPTAGSNAFGNLPSDIVVYVPAGTLSAYQSASNYSSIASKMVEMSA